MAIDISKLFSDITGPANTDLVEGEARLNAMDTPGGMAALLSPQRARAMRQGLGGLFGQGGGMTPQEQVPEAMRGLDINDPNSIAMVIRKLNAVGATKEAAQLKLGLDQLLAENVLSGDKLQVERDKVAVQQRNALTDEQQLLVNQRQATVAENAQTSKNAELDENIRQFNLGLDTPDIGEISFTNSTAKSIAEYELAFADAASIEDDGERKAARIKAKRLLRTKPSQGWEYRPDGEKKDQFENQKYLLWPVADEAIRIRRDLEAKNIAGSKQRSSADGVVRKIDGMIEELDSGAVSTGLYGIIKAGLMPQSNEAAFKGNLEVILANLGYGGLMEAKEGSATGASGFGQLTQKELELLQRLDEDLRMGLNAATLKFRLEEVQHAFQFRSDTAKSDWTLPQFLGHEEVVGAGDAPELPAPAPINTPSGNTFTIVETGQ